MLLAVDIGNSNIKFGIYDGPTLHSKFSLPTSHDLSADALRQAIDCNREAAISDAIVCSVVPNAERTLMEFLQTDLGVPTLSVRNDFEFGLRINYAPISAVGTDRLVNSFAAAERYGAPCVVCSLGTATTFDVVDAGREFLGGVIAPGMGAMAKALHLTTAQLPEIEIQKTAKLINNSTIASIQSGVFYGYLGMVEGITSRIKSEVGDSPKVIATGGFAQLVNDNTDLFDVVDDNLTLDGLRLLHERIDQT